MVYEANDCTIERVFYRSVCRCFIQCDRFHEQIYPRIYEKTTSVAQTDICFVYDDAVLLLVQEDKERITEYGDVQLIAKAITALQCNIRNRVLNKEATEIIPAILMVGTYPVFYKIPVSTELDLSIGSLSYPETETVVTKCSPKVPRPDERYGEGMRPLDNRDIILRYLEAFRRHVFIPCSEATPEISLNL